MDPFALKMKLQSFELPFDRYFLKGDKHANPCHTLVLHGAGLSSRQRFSKMRAGLKDQGLPSAGFDFIGHGDTGGEMTATSLYSRTEQAAAVIRQTCREPLNLIGASMSAYTAIRLTEIFSVENLVLLVPAVYTPLAYHLRFGPAFSAAIRVPRSWKDSDAFTILEHFKGNLLIIAAENDHVIPDEVIKMLHESAKYAKINEIYKVPDSEHQKLFPKSRDFDLAIRRIVEICGMNPV
ncbi:MAG: alpha/beta hydrolase [Desulfobacteraceae bacterium]|nr:alpha/beta hydrolase [Desulfobacteraceae bacterium]